MFKVNFKPFVLLAVFAGIAAHANAATRTDSLSRDYVITSLGDTVKGVVLSLRTASVKIEPITAAPVLVFRFEQVKEICRNGVIYGPVTSLTGDRKHIFAQRIVHGRIDLFEHTISQRYGQLVVYYAGKNGEMPVEVRTNNTWPKGFASKSKRRENLVNLLADDKQLMQQLDKNKDYSPNELIAMIRTYDQNIH